jgi:predicted RNA-binding protein with PIN domain
MTCIPDGYEPCADAANVMAQAAYDPSADVENPPHSVFCAHGAGFVVPWNEVDQYKHLETVLDKPTATKILPSASHLAKQYQLSDEELEAIMLREFGPIKRRQYSEPKINAAKKSEKHSPRKKPLTRHMVILDGYNVIYAWDSLREIADFSLEKARESLMDLLSNYVAFTKTELVLVFDAYLVKDGQGSEFRRDGYRVVFTKQDQTADAYIERMMHELGPDYGIRVVTGDRLLQFSAVHEGILRVTAAEFLDEVTRVGNEITEFLRKLAEEKQ